MEDLVRMREMLKITLQEFRLRRAWLLSLQPASISQAP